MKKIKKGFTLAEILITMGIIGVVSAITVPALMNRMNAQTLTPSLAKSVHDIENATLNIIHLASDSSDEAQTDEDVANNIEIEHGVHTLDLITFNDVLHNDDDELVISSADMFTRLQGATGAIRLDNNSIRYLNNAHFYNSDNLISRNNKYLFINGNNGQNAVAFSFSKSNAIIILEPTSNNTLNNYASDNNDRIEDDIVVARILIDVNGETPPNEMGQDIFIFGIANNGKLVPAGSRAYNVNVFGANLNENLYTQDCIGDTVTGDGVSCAARIINDGWKMNYKK